MIVNNLYCLKNFLQIVDITLDTYADVFDNFQSVSVEQADSYLTEVGLAV